jgi:hypothetical protein
VTDTLWRPFFTPFSTHVVLDVEHVFEPTLTIKRVAFAPRGTINHFTTVPDFVRFMVKVRGAQRVFDEGAGIVAVMVSTLDAPKLSVMRKENEYEVRDGSRDFFGRNV